MPSRSPSGDTRTRILETARELFGAHTYRAASMREIAERVGITKPSLYHHFRSKSEILGSLVGPPIDQLAEAIEAAAARPDEERAQMRLQLLEGCVDAMLDHRATMALLFRDASVYGDETTEVMSRVVGIMRRATELLAGPDPDWRHRVRAAQAFAAVTDPITHFTDVPDDELRAELLRGASAILTR